MNERQSKIINMQFDGFFGKLASGSLFFHSFDAFFYGEADFGCRFTLTSSPYRIAEKAKTDAMDAMEKALGE